ncbi:MAG: DNA polymerase IV [Actinomycetota bacterium]|nr:DNA polymerase IV [Actinomycetota bacterium]
MGRSADIPRSSGEFDGDDAGCRFLHVDMDAFFASVEIQRRPELLDLPVVVGGGTRGVVAAASYAARRFGVRSAMPIGQARRLCPRLVVIPPDRERYAAASGQVMAILRDVTPLVEPLSLDEAFLDVSHAVRLYGRPTVIAQAIRRRVRTELGLTCSVGVASTKFVAKLASARCKPDGILVVPVSAVLDFLHPLPVTVLWGVGARTAQPLHRLGVQTVADLAHTPLDTLQRAVGTAVANHLHALANGRDDRNVQPHDVEKSISSDHTLDTDLVEEDEVKRELLRLSEEVGRRVRDRGWVARTVGIKIRFADFTTITRVRTLPVGTDSTPTIYATAIELYRGLDLDRPRIRLVGVKAENLRVARDAAQQLTLDVLPLPPPDALVPGNQGVQRHGAPVNEARATDRAGAERAIDAARARFGADAVRYATLVRGPAEVERKSTPEPRSDGARKS